MRYFFIIVFLLCTTISCGSGASTSTKKEKKTASTSPTNATPEKIHITNNDNFDVTFEDVGFYNWLAKQSPKSEFLRSSLEITNLQYVTEWNRRVDTPEKYDNELYKKKINYKIHPKKHYGLDVNYELYMYFKFFEEKHEMLLNK